MKKIEAFIRHEAFEAIRNELDSKGIPSMSISEVKGSGRQKGYTETYRGAKSTIFLRPKLKLEIVVNDEEVDTTLEAIMRHAQSGEPGDGKIFISTIDEAIRVRTGERGPVVLETHDDGGASDATTPSPDGGSAAAGGDARHLKTVSWDDPGGRAGRSPHPESGT